ncbi:Translation termination inhibitor protein ITT1 [Rhodotorula toruloides]|nr:Translation termination inhibitor protein ITT1 [Rhodotorula toruloides]
MNERQQEELMALQAIYPDTVSWSLSQDGQKVLVKVALPVEFEEDKDVEVWDWSEEEARREVEPVEALVQQVGKLEVKEEEEQASAPAASGRHKRRRGGRGRGGGASAGPEGHSAGSNARLAPTATPFKPRQLPTAPRIERDAPARTPKPPSAPSAAVKLVPAAPPASTKTTRVRIASRPAETASPSTLPPGRSAQTSTDKQPRRLKLRHLPPHALDIRLSEAYLDAAGPEKVTLLDEFGWLGEERRRKVEETLSAVYTGDECLFALVDLASSSSPDFTSTFSLSFPLVLRQTKPSSDTTPLSTRLSSFNRDALADHFASTSHTCPLCFSPSRGSACIRIESCGCVFDKTCLRDYWSLLIREGLVRSVACPSTGCGEARAKWEKQLAASGEKKIFEREDEKPGRITAEEVESLVGEEGRKRWEWLKEKVRMESDPSITFCPRDSCQAAVPKLSEDEEKLRDYSFCVFCRHGWHGARNACALPQSSAIVSAYLSGTDDERRTLELRYGTANVKRLVAAYEEEKALQEWLAKNSTPCPGCRTPIEKSHGCNHMSCGRCGAHFCFRCGASISPSDPYKHFSAPHSTCYGKLFDFHPGGEPDVGEWIGEILAEDVA